MARFSLLAALLGARCVFAAYDEIFFTSNSTEYKCPNSPYRCIAPSACAHDDLLDKYYCCGPENDVCWSGATKCDNPNDEPSGGQLGCDKGTKWCCINDREACTQRSNQIRVCWATPENPMKGILRADLNETFSSLSSADPFATAFAFKPDAIRESVSGTPTPSSTSSSAASSSTDPAPASSGPSGSAPAATNSDPISAPTSSPPAEESSSGPSGGVIGGAVVGAVAGLALIGAGAFFLLRRRKNKNNKANPPELDGNPYSQHPGYSPNAPQHEKYAHHAHEAYSEPPQQHYAAEMDATGWRPVEMEGSKPAVNPVNSRN